MSQASLVVLREYLSLRPVGLRSAVRLAWCYLRTASERVLRPGSFRGVGKFLPGTTPIALKTGSLKVWARPHSEDLLYLLPAHKPAVWSWFHPSPGDTVIDVGAHIGLFSLRAASAGARVLAVEPNPSTVGVLRANVESNGFTEVTIRSVAVGEGDGEGILWVPPIYDGKSWLVTGWASGNENLPAHPSPVEVRTIDHLVGAARFETIDWMLIDVEGFEFSALRGALESLRVTRHLIVEVSRGPRREACRQLLEDELGFKVVDEVRQSEYTDYWLALREGEHPGRS